MIKPGNESSIMKAPIVQKTEAADPTMPRKTKPRIKSREPRKMRNATENTTNFSLSAFQRFCPAVKPYTAPTKLSKDMTKKIRTTLPENLIGVPTAARKFTKMLIKLNPPANETAYRPNIKRGDSV